MLRGPGGAPPVFRHVEVWVCFCDRMVGPGLPVSLVVRQASPGVLGDPGYTGGSGHTWALWVLYVTQ